MTGVLGEVLPLALVILASPIPIVAVIFVLLAPGARARSVAFLAGWLIGVLVTVAVFTALATVLPGQDPDAPNPWRAALQLALGAVLVLVAVRTWRKRPAPDAEPTLPGWMAAIDSMSAARCAVLALALGSINPKNLLLGAAAGVAIGTAGLEPGETAVVVIIFAVLASLSVAALVLAYLLAAERMAPRLEELRGWLVRENATVMSVLLLVIGTVVLGRGLAAL